ncbi:hypothetical protein [Mycoplasma parvum]|uniref:Uncharacterized protein n=1 Tax=Mycoplasma parvum str. Indiana TaxID=1403316 RepID=U5NC93_9MOLU|nr:hypothetical protein [Mycoplasma parvum]AGX89042.1 hypothetical protein PRV_01410 [Mycoplasma parvum str. Indiana]
MSLFFKVFNIFGLISSVSVATVLTQMPAPIKKTVEEGSKNNKGIYSVRHPTEQHLTEKEKKEKEEEEQECLDDVYSVI